MFLLIRFKIILQKQLLFQCPLKTEWDFFETLLFSKKYILFQTASAILKVNQDLQ